MCVMEAIRLDLTVETDGIINVPEVKQGDKVEVIVLRHKTHDQPVPRQFGWLKGKIRILPGFDDPIPGMEEYM